MAKMSSAEPPIDLASPANPWATTTTTASTTTYSVVWSQLHKTRQRVQETQQVKMLANQSWKFSALSSLNDKTYKLTNIRAKIPGIRTLQTSYKT